MALPLHCDRSVETIDRNELGAVTGGVFYGERKGEHGEKWAKAVDDAYYWAYKKGYTALGGSDTAKNIVGVPMYPFLMFHETEARYLGRAYDALRGKL